MAVESFITLGPARNLIIFRYYLQVCLPSLKGELNLAFTSTMMENIKNDKHSSLSFESVNYNKKRFTVLSPRKIHNPQVIF
jgi:hypothetical protein